MKNLGNTLFITQNAPPYPGAGARRIGELMEKAAQNGKVYLIRKCGEGEPPLPVAEVTKNIDVRDIRSAAGVGHTVSNTRKSNALYRWASRFRQAYPFVYWADNGGRAYRKAALRAAQAIVEEHVVETVISSFRPWSDHLVAAKLKRRYPRLRWIADFRDLPTDPIRQDIWWPELQQQWGSLVVEDADEAWCVSEGQRQYVTALHHDVRVVRNPVRAMPPEVSRPTTDRFTIAYTGSLYPRLQSVTDLISVLRELLAEGVIGPEELLLQYAGRDAATFRKWCKGLPEVCLHLQLHLAPADSQKIQRAATVLLLLNWSAPLYFGVLTAKLYDYLEAGRPIVALVNGPGDRELQEILSATEVGTTFEHGSRAELKAHLTAQITEWRQLGTVVCRPNQAAVRALMW